MLHPVRQHLLAGVVEQEAGLAVQRAAADRATQVTDQAARQLPARTAPGTRRVRQAARSCSRASVRSAALRPSACALMKSPAARTVSYQ